MASAQPASGIVRTVVADRDVRMLLTDLAAGNVCEHVAGEFLGLSASEQTSPSDAQTKKEGAKPKRGRLWIEHCAARRSADDRVTIELEGRGWRWVDKQSEKLGAKFELSQYVRFGARIDAVGTVDLSYARTKHVLTLMLNATEPVRAKVTPLGNVDAKAKGAWAALLGAASSVIGQSPDQQASEKFNQQGSRSMAKQLSTGYTVVVDLCSGQKYETIGDLAEGALPDVPLDPRGRLWKDNERIELMPSGVDLSGPYKREQLPYGFEITTEHGDGVKAQVVCTTEAQRVAEAFLSGKPVPEVQALAGDVVPSGQTKTLRVEEASCDVVLYTRPVAKTAKFAYLAYPEGKLRQPLVPCQRK